MITQERNDPLAEGRARVCARQREYVLAHQRNGQVEALGMALDMGQVALGPPLYVVGDKLQGHTGLDALNPVASRYSLANNRFGVDHLLGKCFGIGRTDRRIERLNHILRWFDRYLKH